MVDGPSVAKQDKLHRLGDVVARNLKTIRTARAMSLSSLAKESGVARATLYQLEAADGNPTIDTLFSIASSLGVALSELVTDSEPPIVQVIRAKESQVLSGPGVTAHLLRRFTGIEGVLELYDLLVQPGHVTEGHEHPPGVFEHVLLNEGELITGPINDPVHLHDGDYVCFRADMPHEYRALNDAEARATLIMHYPPTRPNTGLDGAPASASQRSDGDASGQGGHHG